METKYGNEMKKFVKGSEAKNCSICFDKQAKWILFRFKAVGNLGIIAL
jgi:hypothetical protein